MVEEGRLIMPSLRSSIRKRLEAEEAEQDSPAKEAESNPVEQTDNPVEAAAQEAVEKKLAEQPEPILEPKQPRYEEDDDENDDAVNELELKAAHASAEVAGHRFGTREYVDAIANKLRSPEPRERRERGGPVPMAPVSRESPSWSSGRTTPSKTELTGEEIAMAHTSGISPEEYRRHKARMIQMKAAGVIQE